MTTKVVVLVLTIVLTQSFFPQGAVAAPTQETGVVDVGNKFCPVSGDEVSGKSFMVYEGKRYGLCCPMCEDKFLKNPQKYIAKMELQEKGESVAHEDQAHHMH